jgi:hypothetical protein
MKRGDSGDEDARDLVFTGAANDARLPGNALNIAMARVRMA